MPAFLLSLREGLEAALVVSIVLGTLKRMERPHQARYVWLGVGMALTASVALAAILTILGMEFEGTVEMVFEGVTMLLAMVVLTWMIFWMQRQGRDIRSKLTAQVHKATSESPAAGRERVRSHAGLRLFSVAFLAVFREGVELALFLAATVFATSPGQTAFGALAGLAAAAALGMTLFAGVVHLNLTRFFQVTSLLLILFAAGMVAHSIHEFIEAGLIPGLINPVWNINGFLSDQSPVGEFLKTLFGYNSTPPLTEALAYAGYYVVIWWALRAQRHHAALSSRPA